MPSSRRSQLMLRRLLAVALVGVTGACGRILHHGTSPEMEPVVIQFRNQALDQADVYAVAQSGETLRLGTVQAGRTAQLTIPASMAAGSATVNIIARLLARNVVPQSGPVSIHPGDQLTVTLPPSENMLSVLPAP